MKFCCLLFVATGALFAAATIPGRVTTAEAEYVRLAESGNPRAQHIVADLLEAHGRWEESALWLRRAALQNDVAAQVRLGDFYATRDTARAVTWYEMAATVSTDAMWKLGRMYENGEGVAEDGERALKLYRQAAKKGSAAARNSLGNLSMLSNDYASALRWYRLAASKGCGEALLNLAGMYFQGLGVKRDVSTARRYAAAARRKDVPDAEGFLNEISRVLSRR